jgi:Arc/MetJ family transcription regulator
LLALKARLNGSLVCDSLHGRQHMGTNLQIDPELLNRALQVSGEKTKNAAVTRALEEFIARRQQQRILELFGSLDWDPDYDYKRARSRS